MSEFASLIIPAFIAGLFTFFAPCTLPLVPAYLGFISGVSVRDLKDAAAVRVARKRVLINGFLYVVGFSFVFIVLGTLVSLLGGSLIHYRVWLARIGGLLIIFFGLYLLHVFDLQIFNSLAQTKRFGSQLVTKLKPGKAFSSLIFGMTFAAGWTPCVGPILGTVLLLASTSGHVGEGAFLLFVFSLGLALPFLLLAVFTGHAAFVVKKLTKYLNIISIVGGVFLVFLGALLVTDNLGLFFGWFYSAFGFLNYEDFLLNRL